MGLHRGGRDRRGCAQAKIQHGCRAGATAPVTGPGQVGIDNRAIALAEAIEYLALGGGDIVQAAKALQVCRHGVEQQRDTGPAELTQPGDIARLCRAHLNHREFDTGFQREQGQRHADFIVEVALGSQGPAALRQHGAHHILDRGFAAAAGNRHQRPLEQRPVVGAKAPQRDEGVGNPQLGQGIVCDLADQRGDRASRGNLVEVIVAVEVLTLEGYKQIARCQAPAVGTHTQKFQVCADQLRLQG